MILTGDEIVRMVREGRILIDPFDEKNAGPNSYDLTLSDRLVQYYLTHEHGVLDMKRDHLIAEWQIPEEGLILHPGQLYLGATNERCGSDEFVTLLEGRSSVARLGVTAHVSAGFGDLGFKGRWTCEITCVHPVRIYANVRFCQAVFIASTGINSRRYAGKYDGQEGPLRSMMWKDFLPEEDVVRQGGNRIC